MKIDNHSFTAEDIKILHNIYGDLIHNNEDAYRAFSDNVFSFEAVRGDYKTLYKNHCEYEAGFDEGFRDDVDYETFVEEFHKGYGESDHLQIARLFELSCGIFYDNEYCNN